jgi:hypothetical protein
MVREYLTKWMLRVFGLFEVTHVTQEKVTRITPDGK